MTRSSPLSRSVLALFLGLLLAVRLLTPAGFMPQFEHGSVTIVACPDYDPPPAPMAMSGHHHHNPKTAHQTCPYVAGAAAAAENELALLAPLILVAAALVLGRPSEFPRRPRRHERPHLRGPPLPA